MHLCRGDRQTKSHHLIENFFQEMIKLDCIYVLSSALATTINNCVN